MTRGCKHRLDTSLTVHFTPSPDQSAMCSSQVNPNTDNGVFRPDTRFTLAEMAAMYNSTFAKRFSNNERHAAIRALLRHGAHEDGTHYHTKTRSGLHPAYYRFNPAEDSGQSELTRTALTEAVTKDVFDAVCSTFKKVPIFNQ